MALPIVYVVRVYRGSRRSDRTLTGTVEPADGAWRKSFGSAEELWAALRNPLRLGARGKGSGRTR